MGKKRESERQIALVREASDAVEAIVGHSLGDVRDLTDKQWDETVKLGAKALFVKCLSKGIKAIDAIDAEKLAAASAPAAATTAAILIDKAMDKLLPVLNNGNPNSRIDPADIGALITRVEIQVKELRVSGALDDVPTFHEKVGGQVIDAPVGVIVEALDSPDSSASMSPGSTSSD